MELIAEALQGIIEIAITFICDSISQKLQLRTVFAILSCMIIFLTITASLAPTPTGHIPFVVAFALCIAVSLIALVSAIFGVCLWVSLIAPLALYAIFPEVIAVLLTVSCISAAARQLNHTEGATLATWIAALLMSPYLLFTRSFSELLQEERAE